MDKIAAQPITERKLLLYVLASLPNRDAKKDIDWIISLAPETRYVSFRNYCRLLKDPDGQENVARDNPDLISSTEPQCRTEMRVLKDKIKMFKEVKKDENESPDSKPTL